MLAQAGVVVQASRIVPTLASGRAMAAVPGMLRLSKWP